MSLETTTAEGLFRTDEGLGVWEHRGKVAAVGVGHSPTARRWDGSADSSLGAWMILAIRKAIADAGIAPSDIDGLVLTRDSATGSDWPTDQPIPEDFQEKFVRTKDRLDGLSQLSPEWILANMPELTNVKFVITAPADMSYVLTAAIQAVGDGKSHTCLAIKGWHNFAGRHYHGGMNAERTVSGPGKWSDSLGTPRVFWWAQQFQRYLHKYGKTHEMLAPFVVNSRRNGLLLPEGYWAQHNPNPLTVDDYNRSRWIAKPANLLDHDLPIHTAAAYVVTTAERAKDLRQTPVYVLGHAGSGSVSGEEFVPAYQGGVVETLEEAEENAAGLGRRIYEAAGVSAADLAFENLYDGFSLFHVFLMEGIGFAGVKRGEGLDFFQTDISIDGPNPVSPSGGNIGGGRTRYWMHTDSIQQIQGRAGARQISIPAEVGISGGPAPSFANYILWSRSQS